MAYQDVRSFYEEPDEPDPQPWPFDVAGRDDTGLWPLRLVRLVRERCSRCRCETDVEAERFERPFESEVEAVEMRCLVCGDQWGQWRPLGWLAQQRYTVEAA